jgi:hypothetical protein
LWFQKEKKWKNKHKTENLTTETRLG